MKEFTIVGRPNTGKTLFALNFAGYLGCKTADITFRDCDGYLNCRHFTISEAKRELCGPEPHKTRLVQSLILQVPVGKTGVKFKLNDTCGIAEEIDDREAVRRGMAQALSLLRCSDFIIHIVDLTKVTDGLNAENDIDHEIYRYGIARNRYLLLANKIDLPAARDKLPKLAAIFSQAAVCPVSALYNQGFQAVKTYVAGNA